MSLDQIGTRNYKEAVNFQATDGVAVTPADSDLARKPAVGLYVGTGGAVAVQTLDGTTLTFANVADGTFLPIVVNQVRTTGTDASDIIALY
jgi:hypothetical protein